MELSNELRLEKPSDVEEFRLRVVEINGGVFGSTGKIMFGIADIAKENGIETMCFSPVTSTNRNQEPNHMYEKIGTYRGRQLSVLASRITGRNGCYSWMETNKVIKRIEAYKPDVVHLHNLHDSFINVPDLFSYLHAHPEISVVWTLHDCWAFTGHCTYFTAAHCERWKTGCGCCPQVKEYPKCIYDNSKGMWERKRKWFSGLKNMTIVTPSQWLADLVSESFLNEYSVKVINNGIDINTFKPTASDFKERYHIGNKKIVLGVAMPWSERKGMRDFVELSKSLDEEYRVVMVGLTAGQITALPSNIVGIERTQNAKELAAIYTAADVFVNPTFEDNYPTVNLEARACGTSVVTYNVGGSPESAGKEAIVVPCGDVEKLKQGVIDASKITSGFQDLGELDMNKKFEEYIKIYRGRLSDNLPKGLGS